MEKKFDNLNVNALHLADDDLTHIAETEQLTEAENLRILRKTLDKAGIPQKQKTERHLAVRRPKKSRIRMLGVAIAAALAVGALGLGVSGWLTYNKPLMESYFGSIGDERLQALELPEPVTVSNGVVKATVEACLRDRYKMLVLITFDSADEYGQKIDWFKQMQPDYADECFYYHVDVLDENGEPTWTEENPGGPIRTASGGACRVPENGAISVETELEIMDPDYDAETLMLRFSNTEYGSLDVPVTVTPQLETRTLRAEDGMEMYLSPLGLRTSTAISEHGDEWFDLTMFRSDGTQSRGHLSSLGSAACHGENEDWSYSEAMIYEVTEGMEYQYDDPATYNGFVDISDVVSIDWNGIIFTLAE